MWMCKFCSHETKRRFNVTRHLKLVHNISDQGRNAIGNQTIKWSCIKKIQMDTSDFSNDHDLLSRISTERLMSE